MAEADLGKVRLTEAEVRELVELYNGGVRLGKDEEGNPGFYKYDEAAGADAFFPFSKGGGGGKFIYPSTPVTYQASSTAAPKSIVLRNNNGGYKKMMLKGSVYAKVASGTSRTTRVVFGYYKKSSEGAGHEAALQTVQLCVHSGSSDGSTKEFEAEISLGEAWFPDSEDTAYAPYIGGYISATGSISAKWTLTELIFE